MTSSRGDVSGALTRLDEVDRLRSLYARVLTLQRERARLLRAECSHFMEDSRATTRDASSSASVPGSTLLREALKRNPSYQATERSLLTVPPGAATVPHREAVYAKLAELDAAISTLRTIAAAEPGHRVASSSSSAGTSSSQDMPPSKARKLAHQSISVHGSGESEACPHDVATISEMARLSRVDGELRHVIDSSTAGVRRGFGIHDTIGSPSPMPPCTTAPTIPTLSTKLYQPPLLPHIPC